MSYPRPQFGAYAPIAARNRGADGPPHATPEGVPVKASYTALDVSGLEHLDYAAGIPPYLRGPYATMYTGRPWTIRQYAGFSTAAASNAFYRRALASGQRGISVAFDLATHRGYDSDHPRVTGDVGKAGVAIDTVEDMKVLFEGIPLDDVSVSMTMNGAVIPVMAFFLVAAQEQGVPQHLLRGTIQNDILKEFLVRNTYIYPPGASMRIAGDVMVYCARQMPRFNSVSVSGYHMHEAGAPADLELAYTLGNGLAYLRLGASLGLDIDRLAPRVSFFFGVGMHMLMEAAKLRAARVLWARLVANLGAKDPKSMALRTHCQTSGYSLAAQAPHNNITRTTVEALAATLGHTQSLHTNALDEALALPSQSAARVALNTQLFLQHETDITRSIDPLAGSFVVESLTDGLACRAWDHLQEIESLGGMMAAIRQGIPKMRIEEAAARKQARLDSGQDVLVGVNRYILDDEPSFALLEVDSQVVRAQQVERLEAVRRRRDEARVKKALARVTHAASTKGASILAAAVEAAHARATLGEVSSALERVFGRFEASYNTISGIYAAHPAMKDEIERVLSLSDKFAELHGRRPRILVAKMGQDGHDRGARLVASSFADLGFDVDVGALFQTPAEVARQAIESDVHVLGISTMAGAHDTLIPALMETLHIRGASGILVVVGGIIPPRDSPLLEAAGVASIFGPGTRVSTAAKEVLQLLLERDETPAN